MQKTVGRYAEAVDAYKACIRHRPEFGETYWSLANLKTYRFADADLVEMERRAQAGGLPRIRVNFLFAIAKAHEDRGDSSGPGTSMRRATRSSAPRCRTIPCKRKR